MNQRYKQIYRIILVLILIKLTDFFTILMHNTNSNTFRNYYPVKVYLLMAFSVYLFIFIESGHQC